MKLSHWTMTTLAATLVLGLAGASLTRAADAPAAPATATVGTITGKVVDKDNNPVKGATVQAYTVGDRAAQKKPEALGKSTTTMEDGTFKLEAVPTGKVSVRATMEKLIGRTKEPVEVTADKETKLTDPIAIAPKKARGGNAGGGDTGGAAAK